MSQELQLHDKHFDVFLSYSRKDEEFARKLEEALENYRLPKDVKTRIISKERLNVFRDKRDLVPTDGDYWKTIEGYLNKSANLVVICSPYARQSKYIDHEIKAFLQSHNPEEIIPLLLSGKPNNEPKANPEEYAFPDALCSALSMPLAVEFTDFPRARGKVNRGIYHDSWYALLAKIFGAERAEIERLDAKRQARKYAIAAAISVVVILVLSWALVVAIISRQDAISQRDHARQVSYSSDMNLAQRAFESGNIGLGKALLESYQFTDQKNLRGFEWYYLWRLYNGHLAIFEGANDIAFSRDGAVFATATANTIKFWETASLREKANINPSRLEPITNASNFEYYSIDISPDGKTLAYSDNTRVMLLDISAGSSREVVVRGKPQKEDFWNLEKDVIPRFSPDGRLLAVSHNCSMVLVYDVHSLKEIARLGKFWSSGYLPPQFCHSFVTFSPDGRILAYGDGNVRLWDTVAHRDLGEPEMDFRHPDNVDQVETATFSPDGKILAIGDRSKQVVLWYISTRKVLARLKGHEEWVSAITFSPNGKILYSGGLNMPIRLWDFSSYKGRGKVSEEKIKVYATIKGHTNGILSIKCSPDGKIIASVGNDQTVKLWNAAGIRYFDTVENVEAVSTGGDIIEIRKEDPDEPGTLFDLRSGVPAELWALKESDNLILSPDGKTLANRSPDITDNIETVKLQDVSSRKTLVTFKAQSGGAPPIFSHDGRLFSALDSDGKSLMLWDIAEGKELPAVKSNNRLKKYLFSPDGKVIVTVDEDGLRVKSWDVVLQKQLAGFELASTPDYSVLEFEEEADERPILALSPDGNLLAFSYLDAVDLWKTDSTQGPVLLGKHEGLVNHLAFSPDGKLIASGDEDGVVKVWDKTTLKELATFKGHEEAVTVLTFSPDGRTLASGSDDGTVKLYGMTSLRELISLTHEPSPPSEINAFQGSEDKIVQLIFSADGRSLITRSDNNTLRIWRGLYNDSARP